MWSPRAGGLCLLRDRQQLITGRAVTESAGPGGWCWPQSLQSVNRCGGRGQSVSGRERLSHLRKCIYKASRAGELSEWVKVPGTKPDDPSSVPQDHMVEGENQLCPPHMFQGMCTHTCSTHTCLPMPLLSHTRVMHLCTLSTGRHTPACASSLHCTHHKHRHMVIWPSHVRGVRKPRLHRDAVGHAPWPLSPPWLLMPV